MDFNLSNNCSNFFSFQKPSLYFLKNIRNSSLLILSISLVFCESIIIELTSPKKLLKKLIEFIVSSFLIEREGN